MAAKKPRLDAGDASNVDDQGFALQEGHPQPEDLQAAKPGKIITSIGEDYSSENG